MSKHRWDEIRETETVLYGNYPNGAHESLLRAHRVLGEVKHMISRGDSAETVALFIEWAEADRKSYAIRPGEPPE